MEQLTQSSDKNLSSPFVGMFLVPCELLGLYVFVTCSDHISTFPFYSQPFSLAIQCVHLQIDCILLLHCHCTAMQRKYQAVDMCSVLHQVSCCARITPYLHTLQSTPRYPVLQTEAQMWPYLGFLKFTTSSQFPIDTPVFIRRKKIIIRLTAQNNFLLSFPRNRPGAMFLSSLFSEWFIFLNTSNLL